MRATIFLLRTGEDHRPAGLALVVPQARYLSVRLRHAPRLERRFATPAQWREIECEVERAGSHVVPASSPLHSVIAGDWAVNAQYLIREDVREDMAPAAFVQALDALLLTHPLELGRE